VGHSADDAMRQFILDGLGTLEAILDRDIKRLVQRGDMRSAHELAVRRQELLQLRKSLPEQTTSELLASQSRLTALIKSGQLCARSS
jgi:hypothetical protein